MIQFLVELRETLYKYTFLHLSSKIYIFLNIFYYIILSAGKACVTQNDDFRTHCLEKIALTNILTSLHETRGDVLEENPNNRSYRFAPYKQFIWLIINLFCF